MTYNTSHGASADSTPASGASDLSPIYSLDVVSSRNAAVYQVSIMIFDHQGKMPLLLAVDALVQQAIYFVVICLVCF